MLRANTTRSGSDAFSPFAQNEREVVKQTRSSTSHGVQVGLGPHGPEDSWTEKSVGERFVSPLNKGGGSLLKRVVTLPVVWGSDRVCEPFSWPQWEGAVCCLVQLTCCSASWSGGTWPVMPWRYHLGLVLLHPLGAYPCCSGIHVNKKRGSNISVKRLKWIRGFWVAVVLGGSVSLSDPRSYQLFYL